MNKALKITRIGNSAGIILPKELLATLKAEIGDDLFVTEEPGAVRLAVSDPDFEEQMKVAREVMQRRKRALAELAK